MPSDPAPGAVDSLYREILSAGEDLQKIRRLLSGIELDELTLLAVFRRALPARFLEAAAELSEVSRRPRLLAAIAANPRSPRGLALKLLPSLYWRDLADIAASPRVPTPVRLRAETELEERLPDLKVGERITLARFATPPLLDVLLQDPDPRILSVGLSNPRLREEDLLRALRKETAPVRLLEEAAGSTRFSESYPVRLTLVLQPRTPLPVVMSLLSSILPADLRHISEKTGLAPLVRIAAERLLV